MSYVKFRIISYVFAALALSAFAIGTWVYLLGMAYDYLIK